MQAAIAGFERDGLRWYLENDRGDIVGLSSIHQKTLAMMAALNRRPEPPGTQ